MRLAALDGHVTDLYGAHLHTHTRCGHAVLSMTKGSIKVEFAVKPKAGKIPVVANITAGLAAGKKIKFTTLAANSVVLAADPDIKNVAEVKVTTEMIVKAPAVSQGPCEDGGKTTCTTDAACADKDAKFTCTCKPGFSGKRSSRTLVCWLKL